MRIAVSTGGGDCPGLNAVIRAVVKGEGKRDLIKYKEEVREEPILGGIQIIWQKR